MPKLEPTKRNFREAMLFCFHLRGSPYPELSKNRFFFFFNRWNYYQRILSQNFTVHIGIVLMVEFRAVALRKLIFHRLKTLKRVFSKPHFSKLRARLKKKD